jgi:hypothetical protein
MRYYPNICLHELKEKEGNPTVVSVAIRGDHLPNRSEDANPLDIVLDRIKK